MSCKIFLIGIMQKFWGGCWCKPSPKVWVTDTLVLHTSVVCCHTFGSGHTNNLLLGILHCSLNHKITKSDLSVLEQNFKILKQWNFLFVTNILHPFSGVIRHWLLQDVQPGPKMQKCKFVARQWNITQEKVSVSVVNKWVTHWWENDVSESNQQLKIQN